MGHWKVLPTFPKWGRTSGNLPSAETHQHQSIIRKLKHPHHTHREESRPFQQAGPGPGTCPEPHGMLATLQPLATRPVLCTVLLRPPDSRKGKSNSTMTPDWEAHGDHLKGVSLSTGGCLSPPWLEMLWCTWLKVATNTLWSMCLDSLGLKTMPTTA